MQVNPNHVKTLCALATLERRSGHHKAAKVHLRNALALQPTNPVALRVSSAPLADLYCEARAAERLQITYELTFEPCMYLKAMI